MSLLQGHLEKRKDRRKAAEKDRSRATGAAAGSGGQWTRSATSASAPPRSSPSTARRAATPSTGRPPARLRECTSLRGRRRRARHGPDRRRRIAFCAGADLKALDTSAAAWTGRADGLHAPDAVQADDRRDRRLVPGRRARARAVVRPADRRRGRAARLPRAPLGRAADRRRHPAAAADRRPRPRARPDPHRPDRRRRRGAGDGAGQRDRARRAAPRRARSRWPRGSPRSRRRRCSPTAWPRSRASACRSHDGLALEARSGLQTFAGALEGASRFAGGEGRGGAGAGV